MKRRSCIAMMWGGLIAPVWALPGESVYHLNLSLTDQQGQDRALDAWRGKPVLVSMIYTSCQMMCPMIIEAMRATDAMLTPAQREGLGLLLVSFDPERDTVPVLKAMAERRGLTAPHWTLARSDARSVRRLAAVLGVQYRPTADGEFNHTSVMVLLDAEGRVVARTNKMSGVDADFLRHIRQALG